MNVQFGRIVDNPDYFNRQSGKPQELGAAIETSENRYVAMASISEYRTREGFYARQLEGDLFSRDGNPKPVSFAVTLWGGDDPRHEDGVGTRFTWDPDISKAEQKEIEKDVVALAQKASGRMSVEV